MKTKTTLLLAGIVLTSLCNSPGQIASNVTFTRITTGDIVTDSADSFGCAWGDYDGDGYLDMFVGNGFGDANALYRNNGNGTFTKITTGTVVTTIGDAGGVVWADYDNDGDLDLFVANFQLADFLFRNDGGGNFTRVFTGGIGSDIGDSNGAAWGDYNNDGLLDLIVANAGNQNEFLYRNQGDGTFARVFSGPIPNGGGHSGAPFWTDYDNDGRIDLFLSPVLDSTHNILFHNDGDGNFSAANNSLTVDSSSGGGDWGDYDNDGDLDLFVGDSTSPGGSRPLIYRNDGGGGFTRRNFVDLVTNGGVFSGGGIWGDYDNDGLLDLLGVGFSGQKALFRNNGDGTFTRMTGDPISADVGNTSGAAWADYDNDGFVDLYLANGATTSSQANSLYHNGGNSNRWLRIKCMGAASNRSGIGAKVRVRANIGGVARWQLREVTSGNGYIHSGLLAYLGLGDATNVDLVRIEWPSGTVQELRNVAVNQILTVKEPPVLTTLGKDVSGAFRLLLKGGRGLPYTVEYSTNLVQWNWLTGFAATNTLSPVTDPDADSSPHRFYRAREDD